MKHLVFLTLAFILSLALLSSCGKDKSKKETDNKADESSQSEIQEENKQQKSEESTGIPSYAISFYDENKNLLEKKDWKEGSVPSYSYKKTDTAEWKFTVEGFSATEGGAVLASIPAATAEASYYAIVSKTKQTYTLTFESNEGTAVNAVTAEYGEEISVPQAPTRKGFRFVSWCTDETLENAVTWPMVITDHKTIYAKWNETVDIPALLSTLLDSYDISPYAYIPEMMQAEKHTITSQKAELSYASAVSVSNIPQNGFGEQWSMIIDNIEQSQTFFNILSVVEGISSTAVSAFNNYLDTNPENAASYTFRESIYSIAIHYDGRTLHFVVDYTANIPVLGNQTVQIYLSLDSETGAKTARIQLGEANALTYTITDSSYTFAIKYLGIRTATTSFVKDENGNITGSINEYLTIAGKGLHSAADFIIRDGYIIAVGNKASGLVGFTGYICELYDATTGKMLGYEVMETQTTLQVTFNTLWFQLADVGGLSTLRYEEATEETDAAFFVNGSAKAWQSKTVGGFSLKTASRRYDLEFRSQYFYSYNEEEAQYEKIEVQVPMLFVQAENMETFSTDVTSKNSTLSLTIAVSESDMTALTDAYANDIPAFIEHKESVTEDAIKAIIGTKYSAT